MSEPVSDFTRFRAPSVIYHTLTNAILDPGVINVLQDLDDKDLFVLQSLLNQAQSNVHREMARRNGHAGPVPPW